MAATNIIIKDTGYPNITNTGSQDSVLANSGNAITLKAVDITWNRGSGKDDSPSPGLYNEIVVNQSSIENPKINISGIIQSGSVAALPELDKLVTTKGVKLLYGGTAFTENFGVADSTHPSEGNHLHILARSVRVTQAGNSGVIRYSLVCEVTE